MDITTVQENVRGVIKDLDRERFIYNLLLAYGKPKASITRLEKGSLNLSRSPGEVVWKKNVWFRSLQHSASDVSGSRAVKEASSQYDLHALADRLRKSDEVAKHGLRFVVVTDFSTLLAVDTKTAETLDVSIDQLDKHSHFFLPWAGLEKHVTQSESLADIKAAYRMAKLYDQICKDNPVLDAAAAHALNVFLSRLLFCFFAEDTEIFPKKGMFTSAIASHTKEDGSDLDAYLDTLFDVMNSEIRKDYPAFLDAFPYVNGGLLSEKLAVPKFSRHSRKIIIECGEMDWSEINPDIFGSMMQAVVHTDQRSETGMHYTSVGNIMKVIEPLFLSDLREEFEDNFDSAKGLERLRNRISQIKIFDPACGSGNFLIIAFKELRKLEMEIYLRLRELNPSYQTMFTRPQIQLTQFYGVEIDDFAHEIATLSLWLAEHQMNVKFKQNLGILVPPLPLNPSGKIVCGNAVRLDWTQVCPRNFEDEVYVLGNPPYNGARKQEDWQKEDMRLVFDGNEEYKDTDYVACWLLKAAEYISNCNARFAFVATSSVAQGEQVAYIWPRVFERSLEIGFAHQSFKWTNNAKGNAGVSCVIVGVRNQNNQPKLLFDAGAVKTVPNISPYLSAGKTIFARRLDDSISKLPPMVIGSMARDGGNLILTADEHAKLISLYPEAAGIMRRLYGSEEFINGQVRWCLWIQDDQLDLARSIPGVRDRIDRVYQFRVNSKAKTTNGYSAIPHKFAQRCVRQGNAIILPKVSSERRLYIPIGFLGEDAVITDAAFAVNQAELWLFALLTSRMHNVWVKAVTGRLEDRIRYSAGVCYNTFPVPELSNTSREMLATHAINVLTEREQHPEKTVGQMYEPEIMPPGLLTAHQNLDKAVERCYRTRPFADDIERLEYLFELYERMTPRLG